MGLVETKTVINPELADMLNVLGEQPPSRPVLRFSFTTDPPAIIVEREGRLICKKRRACLQLLNPQALTDGEV